MINMIIIMVDIFILVPTSISHRIIFGRLAYHGKILDFPSAYHNVMASSLPSFSPSEGFRFRTSSQVQRSRKRFVNLAKQDPGRAKQNSQATAGTNFTKPCTSHFRGLCTKPGKLIMYYELYRGPVNGLYVVW